MKRNSGLVLCCMVVLFGAQAATIERPPIEYSLTTSEPRRSDKGVSNIVLETVQIETVVGMRREAIKNVNVSLNTASREFEEEAIMCGSAAQGRPWNYKIKLDKILLSPDYLSIIFAKSTVCAGSPSLMKEAKVFLIANGKQIRGVLLATRMLPSAKIAHGITKDRIRLDLKTTATMIEDSKTILPDFDEGCNFFLRNTSYSVWIDNRHLVLFPEFVQPSSHCQNEYIIRADGKPGKVDSTK